MPAVTTPLESIAVTTLLGSIALITMLGTTARITYSETIAYKILFMQTVFLTPLGTTVITIPS